jgi:hypothetical protein
VRRPGFGWLLSLAAAAVPAAHAHHSFGNIYDSGRSVTLEAIVTQFLFVHPHPYLVVDVAGEGGNKQSWRAEMDNRFELEDIGITAETFRPGDRVVVSGSPGRNEPRILYLWRLERPSDGMRYEQVGSTPHIHLPQSNGNPPASRN